MAESTLSLVRADLRNAVSWYLGFNPVAASASSDQQTIIDRCVDSGLRAFYSPVPLPGERVMWMWSFMQPEFTIGLDPNQKAVDLPDDFGGFVGSLYFSTDDLSWDVLRLTGIGQILQERQRDSGTNAGAPRLAAVQVLPTTGAEGQRFALEVWPTPDSNYTLKGVYLSNPYQLTASLTYPLGGQPHAETLRMACLAAAERDVNGEIGVNNAEFKERLIASVNWDRRATGPKWFGINADGGRNKLPSFERTGYTTYEGIYGDEF